jgi:hypothetical protein
MLRWSRQRAVSCRDCLHLDYYSRLRLPTAEFVAAMHAEETGHRVKVRRRG